MGVQPMQIFREPKFVNKLARFIIANNFSDISQTDQLTYEFTYDVAMGQGMKEGTFSLLAEVSFLLRASQRARTHAHARTQARTHARTHTRRHAHSHARTRARTHTRTRTRTRIHTYVHTHYCTHVSSGPACWHLLVLPATSALCV